MLRMVQESKAFKHPVEGGIRNTFLKLFLSKCFRKYAIHLFTKPLSNAISDNMMSRLILTFNNKFLIINLHI